MKKSSKIIIGVIVVLALTIVIISLFVPSVYNGLTSGTFGKAEKYRKEQMNEQDILLRSEFTKDTAQLHSMITGLIYFTLFTENLSKTIDSCMVSFRYQGFDKDPRNTESIRLLNDYNQFIRNNLETVAHTARLLSDIYLQDSTAHSVDIEQNLRDFAVFVNQVNEKDSVLMLALESMDHFLVGNQKLQQNKEEIRKLKSIRDEIVLQSVQFFALTGNKSSLGSMLSYALQSQEQFQMIKNLGITGDVGSFIQVNSTNMPAAVQQISSSAVNMNVVFSASSALSAGQVSSAVQSRSDNISMVVYNRQDLSFNVLYGMNSGMIQGMNLSNVLQSGPTELSSMGLIHAGELSVVVNSVILCNALQSATIKSVMSASQLNIIIPATELYSAAQLAVKEGGSTAQINSLVNNAALQYVVSSQPTFSGFEQLMSTSMGFVDVVE